MKEITKDEAFNDLRKTLKSKKTLVGKRTKVIISSIKNCARCGGNHEDLVFNKLRRPTQTPEKWSHWASCPKTKEPILLRVI
jgi:hypothetical protein